jgi:hypothetical protein
MRWTEDQYDNWQEQRRQAWEAAGEGPGPEEADPGLENELQSKCLTYCREHGWPVFHDRSKKKNKAGWPDLFIFMPESKLILIELKSAAGKLRKEQKDLKLQLNWLGHEVYVVKSFKRFLEVVGNRN